MNSEGRGGWTIHVVCCSRANMEINVHSFKDLHLAQEQMSLGRRTTDKLEMYLETD